MSRSSHRRVLGVSFSLALIAFCSIATARAQTAETSTPLPSWNDVAARTSILDFVKKTTTAGSPDFVPPAERIAVFDNDGTLWCEQPMYVQARFAIDRVKTLAAEHPEWKTTQPQKAALEGDIPGLINQGEKAFVDLLMLSHAGMTPAEFDKIVLDWLATAKHPKYDRPYTQCVYLPMVEVLSYLRENGYKTYIVSGGGIEFMRPWTYAAYGIPPEQVVGSSIKLKYAEPDGKPTLIREPAVEFIDDKSGKPIGIQKFIGRRPIMAFGNSDGDFEMLKWTSAGAGPRFGLIVHHTDAEREYAYDRKSSIGRLDKALDAAGKQGWTVVDMKTDWKTIFVFQK
ncbi:MAG: HAD family hydrolase [Pirellulales bacterium]